LQPRNKSPHPKATKKIGARYRIAVWPINLNRLNDDTA
jgi:hypothetical protein